MVKVLRNGQIIEVPDSEFPSSSPTVDMVKQEAHKRILQILPDWKQRNLTARAAELAAKGAVNWTLEEQAEWDAGQSLWNVIKAIIAKSDALELMNPIPSDFYNNVYWE